MPPSTDFAFGASADGFNTIRRSLPLLKNSFFILNHSASRDLFMAGETKKNACCLYSKYHKIIENDIHTSTIKQTHIRIIESNANAWSTSKVNSRSMHFEKLYMK